MHLARDCAQSGCDCRTGIEFPEAAPDEWKAQKLEVTMTDVMNMHEEKSISADPLLEVHKITKRFPGVLALHDVSLEFMPGEVHAVVGENGAGKSTLMKIVAGAYIADAGEIFLSGEKVSFAHPKEAHEKGISIIYQEFNLLPERTVAHNIFLGREPSRFGVIDVREMNRQAKAVLEEIGVGDMISPTALAGSLSVAEQQLVEIAKAISFNAKVLIMDEPTAALTYTEVKLLADLVGRLKRPGDGHYFHLPPPGGSV
jgi:ribose transport system ATP-binding protein